MKGQSNKIKNISETVEDCDWSSFDAQNNIEGDEEGTQPIKAT